MPYNFNILEHILAEGLIFQKDKINFLCSTKFDTYANEAEEKIVELLRKSLLNYWVIPNPYKKDKEELCDILMIFKNDIIIISDKSCGITKKPNNSNDLEKKWSNFCDGLSKSKSQLKMAMEYIKLHSNEIYSDKDCFRNAPLDININEDTKFHLITTVSNWTDLIKNKLNNDGSLLLNTETNFVTRGESRKNERYAFTLHNIPDNNIFYHMIDEVNLFKIIKHINTPTDLIKYLKNRENLIRDDINQQQNMSGETEQFLFFPFIEKSYLKTQKTFISHTEKFDIDYILETLDFEEDFTNKYNCYKQLINNQIQLNIEETLKTFILGSIFYDRLLSYVSSLGYEKIEIMQNEDSSTYSESYINLEIIEEIKAFKYTLDKFASLDRNDRIQLSKSIHLAYDNANKKYPNQTYTKPVEVKGKKIYIVFYNSPIEEIPDLNCIHAEIGEEIFDKAEKDTKNRNKEILAIFIPHPNCAYSEKVSFYCN